jgi:hypothetical protein
MSKELPNFNVKLVIKLRIKSKTDPWLIKTNDLLIK